MSGAGARGIARRRRRQAPRHVAIAGRSLDAGRHEIALPVPGAERELLVHVIVGARKGPRAFVVGGLVPGDAMGLAIVRAVARAVDPAHLAGTLVAIGRAIPPDASGGAGDTAANEDETLSAAFRGGAEEQSGLAARLARFVLELITEKAAFGVELRAGPADRACCPHVRADLTDERVGRLARAFGAEIVLDVTGPKGSLRRAATAAGVPTLVYEAGEQGRHDPTGEARAVAGVLNLLRSRKMLSGGRTRPSWRATVVEATWLRCRTDGWVSPIAAPGAIVLPGDSLAEICDASGRAIAVVTAAARSVVLAAPSAARVTAKTPLYLIARVRTATRPRVARAAKRRRRIGWCEWIALPDLAVARLHAKIDTGARTSALHVKSMRTVGESNGKAIMELRLPVGRRTSHGDATARVIVEGHLVVRDSGGHAERRPVIETTLVLGPVRRKIHITLTNRGDMLFPMLVGRTALGDRFDVDAAARHLLGR